MNVKQILENAPHGAQRYIKGRPSPYLRKTKSGVEHYQTNAWVLYKWDWAGDSDWNEAVTLESLRKAHPGARLYKASEPPRSDEGVGKHSEVFRKADWSKAPDYATHALTTGPKWCGPSDTIGTIKFGRVNDTGEIRDAFGAFIISDDAWVVLETRPDVSQGNTVDQTVTERGERYGKFKDGSVIMQDLKNVMRDTPNWEGLTPSQREALEMIQHKIGRILNGDPMYDDNWRDICGYSQLVLDELNGTVR